MSDIESQHTRAVEVERDKLSVERDKLSARSEQDRLRVAAALAERDAAIRRAETAEADAAEQIGVLELWWKWWHGPGHENYDHPVLPPITRTHVVLAENAARLAERGQP